MGKTGIYQSLSDIPDNPWREGRDYLNEGTQIRIPNNGSYSGTLYWRGITPPADINAATQPSLFPEASRELIAIKAAYNFACEGNRNPELADRMYAKYQERFPYWCLTWRTAFRNGGALGTWTGRDMAIGGANWTYPV